jgi:NADH:ubiquinone oxidoreductase subunit 6 (subunit J)
LGNAVLACVVNQGLRAVFAVNYLLTNAQLLGEVQVAIYRWAVFCMHGRRFTPGA